MGDKSTPPVIVRDEVARALSSGGSVVALESTIITHGMPYPRNLQTAIAAEAEVRQAGSTPATIAVVEGSIHVGLSEAQLAVLADPGTRPSKCSTRDIPFQVLEGKSSGTTVAATMHIATAAGIKVFATGGIGGVHRGAQQSMDVSADLQALARYPMIVVCAGPKAVLDLGLTLEHLETHAVPVVGFCTDVLPAFYTRESAFRVDYRLDEPAAIAHAAQTQWHLGLNGAVLVVNPVPAANAMEPAAVESIIEAALMQASMEGVSGKAVTPFLLEHIKKATHGESLDTNVALMLNNARLAGQVALSV